jgi:hypothetical protein
MRKLLVLVCALILGVSTQAWAQAAGTSASGSIWGKVTDETGGMLPGVTVTIESPALLGVQTAVTNEQGIYRFPSLSPGDFKLTFSLPGFNTLVREGIHLTAAFTATLDAQLKVSAVAETVQVIGQSPVVDSVNTRVQTSFSKEVLASVPSARDMWAVLGSAPAIQMNRIDVGGSTAGTQTGYSAYGVGGQTKPVVEGIIGLESSGAVGFYYDYGSFEEINIGAAGQGAEMATPGVQSVFVSKSGGNQIHGDFYADYENEDLQARNIDAKQLALGVREDSNRVYVNRDLNFGAGGPFIKDKFWWYGSIRDQDIEFLYPTLPQTPFVTKIFDWTAKLTYQLPQNNKLVAYMMWGLKRQPYRHDSFLLGNTGFQSDPSATWNQWNPGWVWKFEWNKSIGNNLFVEARVGQWFDDWHQKSRSDEPRREDTSTRYVYGGNRNWVGYQHRPQTTGALSYYNDRWAGSHQIKLGWEIQMDQRRELWQDSYPGNVVHVLRNGVPSEIYHLASDLNSTNQLFWDSIYLTDTWTRHRLSINLGVRWDRYDSAYPDQERPASRFYEAADIPGRHLIVWNVFAPRIGFSWDITGSARNVLKVHYGRYYWNPTRTVPNAVNPNNTPQWRRYRWTDTNRDGFWQPGEEGALLATRGGFATQDFDPKLKDTYTDQVSAWFERELGERFGVRVGGVFNHHSRRFQTRNALTPPEAYTIPIDVRDPGPDGVTGTADDGTVLHLLNLNPALIGRTFNMIVNVPDYDESARSLEVTATRRFANRWSLSASWAATWRNDFNAIPYNPNGVQQSDYLRMTFVKVNGSIEPGWGLRITPLVRYQSGTPFARSVSISMNYGSQTVLVEPTGAQRMNAPLIFDVRAERRFALRPGMSVSGFFDCFNIANSNAAVTVVTSSGSTYLRPSAILPPRVFRVGAKFSW